MDVVETCFNTASLLNVNYSNKKKIKRFRSGVVLDWNLVHRVIVYFALEQFILIVKIQSYNQHIPVVFANCKQRLLISLMKDKINNIFMYVQSVKAFMVFLQTQGAFCI